mgnify:CR=1 FL=1
MNNGNAAALFRRITVALDDSMQSSQALQEAAELAASLQAELEGIFIEDINLIHLAELPFTREIRPASMTQEVVNSQRMEQELRSLARQQQKKLELVANEKGIRCSFRIRRGQIKTELMEAVTEADILTLSRPGQVAEKFTRQSASLSLQAAAFPAQQASPSVSVIFGPAASERKALMAAARLASYLDVGLNILVNGESDTETDELLHEAMVQLESQKQSVNYLRLPGCQVSDLVKATLSSNSRVLLLNSNNSLVTDGQLWSYLEQVSCPLLIVRETAENTANA